MPLRLNEGQQLVHVHADPEELCWLFPADLPINAGMRAFAAAGGGVFLCAACLSGSERAITGRGLR